MSFSFCVAESEGVYGKRMVQIVPELQALETMQGVIYQVQSQCGWWNV